ncbi:MAG: hypothetical protein HQK77_19990, partial [Desulfobacterales bacterium]|nr:hypothetical protein [Desulfobacterales bacterium]
LRMLHADTPNPKIHIEIPQKTSRLKIGEKVKVCVTPNHQSHYLLLNINLDAIYMLLPWLGNKTNVLKASETNCSTVIEVAPPAGKELLIALSILDSNVLSEYRFEFTEKNPFVVWKYDDDMKTSDGNALEFCRSLFFNILSIPLQDWSISYLSIEIVNS